MESHGAGLHDRPSLTKEIKLGEREIAHGCSQECVGRGKSSLKEGDLQIRGDIEIEVSP